MQIVKKEKGQAIIEYTLMVALLGLVMAVAIANVADNLLDIWNDLLEDIGTIKNCVADIDIECPESNEDNGNGNGNGNNGNGCYKKCPI